MSPARQATEHVAAEPTEETQACARCGCLLSDYRERHALAGNMRAWWNSGERVVSHASGMSVRGIYPRPAALCRPTGDLEREP